MIETGKGNFSLSYQPYGWSIILSIKRLACILRPINITLSFNGRQVVKLAARYCSLPNVVPSSRRMGPHPSRVVGLSALLEPLAVSHCSPLPTVLEPLAVSPLAAPRLALLPPFHKIIRCAWHIKSKHCPALTGPKVLPLSHKQVHGRGGGAGSSGGVPSGLVG